jgi:hypothetical protein
MSDGASGVAEPPVEKRPFQAPDSDQKGYIEVSKTIPPKSDEPLVSPPPLTDPPHKDTGTPKESS